MSPELRRRLRRAWWRAHVLLGLCVGAWFALVGATGSVLVFYHAIDEWLNPELLAVARQGAVAPLDEVVAAARGASLPGGWLDGISLPRHERATVIAWHKVPTGSPGAFDWWQARVDPYTGVLSGPVREWGRYPVSFIYELHESLLVERSGHILVGCLGITLLLSLGTGVMLWWPKPGALRQALTVPAGGSLLRRQAAWHKVGGISSVGMLAALTFTGICLEFPSYAASLVALVSPVEPASAEQGLRSSPVFNASPLSVDVAVGIAQRLFPSSRLVFVGVPHEPAGVYRVVMRLSGAIGAAGGLSQVWLDQYSGTVLKVRDGGALTKGETFIAWLFPIHNGEAFGLAGRWIICVAGVMPMALYVTGLRMWWLKRRAHQRQAGLRDARAAKM